MALSNGNAEERTQNTPLPPGLSSREEWIKLNVGGTVFLTTKTTLCKERGSVLAKLAQGDPDFPSIKDDQGAFLIDRDPRYFLPILNFLRHGTLIIDGSISEEAVLEEAEFYNIISIIELIKNERASLNSSGQVSEDRKRIYRVLHCQESELTQTLSALSDGWKMTQLVNIGSHYMYSNEDQSEFLVVVSQEIGEQFRSYKPTNKEMALKQHGSRM